MSLEHTLHHRLPFFCLFLAAVLTSSAGINAQTDPTWFEFGASARWQQTVAEPNWTRDSSGRWSVDAYLTEEWSSRRISVTSQESAASFEMYVLDPEGATQWWGGRSYASRGDLVSDWPHGGTVLFEREGYGWPDDSGTIIFSVPEPEQVPTFVNFDAIQSINPFKDFTFEWAAWANPSEYRMSSFFVSGPGVSRFSWVGTETSFTVPAGNFRAGETYHAFLTIRSDYLGTDAEWGGTPYNDSLQSWDYTTSVVFTTIPEPSTWAWGMVTITSFLGTVIMRRDRR